ncbi:MAG: type II toxin-antitoxin system RelB/DinJ family antitoxin [Bacillota bacterium]
MASMNIRMDEQVKKEAEALFGEMGMNMTTAINIFLRQSIRESKIPFEIKVEQPNAVSRSAFEEGDRIATDKSVKGYNDMKSLREALGV